MAKITVMFGSETLNERTLDKAELKVARAVDCDVVVDNLGVSRHHCTIVKDGEGWAVTDAGSNNGTYVNGQKITKHVLKDGDKVVLGKHALVFDAHGSATGKIQKKAAGMGGEMTMFVDQQALAKAMAAEVGGKRMALVLIQGGREVPVQLIKDETTIGTAGDIPARGFLVKAVQAKVVRFNQTHRLVSMGGWRKVKVNGQAIAGDGALKPGDVISIAGATFTYKPA